MTKFNFFINHDRSTCSLGAVEYDAEDWYGQEPFAVTIRNLGVTHKHTIEEIEEIVKKDTIGASDGDGRAVAIDNTDTYSEYLWQRLHEDGGDL